MSTSILQIWNLTPEQVRHELDLLEEDNLPIFEHSDPHISLLMSMGDYLNDEERIMLGNKSFMTTLSGSYRSHERKLIHALYHAEQTYDFARNFAKDGKLKQTNEQIAPSHLEFTRGLNLDEICQQNVKIGGVFYDHMGFPLNPENIFNIAGRCFDAADIYDYIRQGGTINLLESRAKNFFAEGSKVDYSKQDLTDQNVGFLVFRPGADYIDLSNNKIESGAGLVIPEGTRLVDMSKNSMNSVDVRFPDSVQIFNISHNFMTRLVSENLPPMCMGIQASSCSELRGLDLSGMQQLKTVNIDGSHIRELRGENFPPSLISLNAYGSEHLENLFLRHSSIQKLFVGKSRIRSITSDTIPHDLNTLNVNECDQLSEINLPGHTVEIVIQAQKCNNLQSVMVPNCATLDLSHTNYRKLDRNLIPESTEHLILKHCTNLSELNLKGLERLKSVDVSHCPILKEFISIGANSLEWIDIRGSGVSKLTGTISIQKGDNRKKKTHIHGKKGVLVKLYPEQSKMIQSNNEYFKAEVHQHHHGEKKHKKHNEDDMMILPPLEPHTESSIIPVNQERANVFEAFDGLF